MECKRMGRQFKRLGRFGNFIIRGSKSFRLLLCMLLLPESDRNYSWYYWEYQRDYCKLFSCLNLIEPDITQKTYSGFDRLCRNDRLSVHTKTWLVPESQFLYLVTLFALSIIPIDRVLQGWLNICDKKMIILTFFLLHHPTVPSRGHLRTTFIR